MKIKKLILVILSIFIFMGIPPFCYASEAPESVEDDISQYNKGKVGVWEEGLTDVCLYIGDFTFGYISKIIGQEAGEITIDALIFNKIDAVNPNFFNKGRTDSDTTNTIKELINKWFGYFRTIAILSYIIATLASGIKVILQDTPFSRTEMKDVISKWTMGILMIFFFPYVIKYAFELNEALVGMIKENVDTASRPEISVGAEEDYSKVQIEYRSPEYVSKYTGEDSFMLRSLSSTYVKNIKKYRNSLDFMRLMRAYAGATKAFIYVILWFIMMYQLIFLLIKYYKRYFVIAILLTLFPLVMIYYVIQMLGGKNPAVFSAWCKEMFTNIFMQSIHAITYAITIGVTMAQMRVTSGIMNWIFLIVSISFLFKGEAIIRKILGADKAVTATAVEDTAKTGRQKVKQGWQGMGKIFKGR